jgi:hypothetical protein
MLSLGIVMILYLLWGKRHVTEDNVYRLVQIREGTSTWCFFLCKRAGRGIGNVVISYSTKMRMPGQWVRVREIIE